MIEKKWTCDVCKKESDLTSDLFPPKGWIENNLITSEIVNAVVARDDVDIKRDFCSKKCLLEHIDKVL